MKTKLIIAGLLLWSTGLASVSEVKAAELGAGDLVHVALDDAAASFAVTYTEGDYDLTLKVDNETIGQDIQSKEVTIPFTISNGFLEDTGFTVEVKAVDTKDADVSQLVTINSSLHTEFASGGMVTAQSKKETNEHLSVMLNTSEGWSPEQVELVKSGFNIVYTISKEASSEALVK